MTVARAYVNHGTWVADCPRKDCNNAIALMPRQETFYCVGFGGCNMIAPVDWPRNADEIWEVLERRPVGATRNWFPAGHELALRANCPNGQTVSDLIKENKENGVL